MSFSYSSNMKISKSGHVQRPGLMEIARSSAAKMKDSDLYIKILSNLEEIIHDREVCKMDKGGRGQMHCSRTRMKDLIHRKYFLKFETSIGVGSVGIIFQAIDELKA